MKPDWDKLIEDFKDSKTAGVYDVDCTAGGKELCEEVGVTGYPTIKYGDPSDKSKLEAYNGGRSYDDLKKFADENLGPVCGPKALDACSEADRATLEELMKKPKADLDAEIQKLEKAFGDRRKKLTKAKRKFDEKNSDFMGEWSELQSDKSAHEKAKAKFDEAKASKQEKAKQAEKDKKFAKRLAAMEKKKAASDAQKEKFEKEKADLDKEVKDSGVAYMKAVRAAKGKDEL